MENVSPSLLYLLPSGADDSLSPSIRARGWNVYKANHPQQAIELMSELDLCIGLVQLEGFDAQVLQAERLFDSNGTVNWVALVPRQSAWSPTTCQLIADYCYDYHTTPVDLDRLVATLGHAHGMAKVVSRARSAYNDLPLDPAGELHIIGQSPCMQNLRRQIRKVAASDFNVIIRGESGTGKELVAQAMHRLSRRSEQPFVAVNCGALPKDLIQAELFGHEKGSFTGADQRRVGRIEAAQGGTLFLDEIGDLPLNMQVNLLRFLQEKTIQRVGGIAPIPVDTRVIAATHVNLEKATAEGHFREDLYYRLNVLHIEVPPLRHRSGDIELLAHYFFKKFASSFRPMLKGFSQQAIDDMNSYLWPGNVRELQHRVLRAVVMCEGKQITSRDLAMDQPNPNAPLATLAKTRALAEKSAIEASLAAARNNVSKAARYLAISRVTLYRLMEQHGIDWQRSQETAGG
ncbi:MAG TPA: sigma-54 dependent transcriptional regulator [Gammaproteobacteria bacterium]|nr:sigma-54 dependent transcriptional regulator [Gammaproteobacteria bacterium]